MKLAIAQLMQSQPSVMIEMARKIEDSVNTLAEGRLAGRHFNATVIPTTGSFGRGDMVWDSAPTEAGAPGAMFVRLGWVCVVAGSPGTLVEMRVLTGN